MARALAACVVTLLAACTSVPDGIRPVQGFELERYLGTWYELARYDHRFERGLERVSAEYSLRDDGGVDVLNRGMNGESGEWSEARGRAYFVDTPDVAHLKVAFFGPFYGSYVVFELDPDYRWAWVAGYDRSYLWLLSREPELDAATWERLLALAEARGYDTDRLIRVDQSGS